MPDDLAAQIHVIRELIAGYNIPIFELEGYEADDVMATLAAKYAKADTEVVLGHRRQRHGTIWWGGM